MCARLVGKIWQSPEPGETLVLTGTTASLTIAGRSWKEFICGMSRVSILLRCKGLRQSKFT